MLNISNLLHLKATNTRYINFGKNEYHPVELVTIRWLIRNLTMFMTIRSTVRKAVQEKGGGVTPYERYFRYISQPNDKKTNNNKVVDLLDVK